MLILALKPLKFSTGCEMCAETTTTTNLIPVTAHGPHPQPLLRVHLFLNELRKMNRKVRGRFG